MKKLRNEKNFPRKEGNRDSQHLGGKIDGLLRDGDRREKIETKMSHITTFVYRMYGPLGAVPGWPGPAARTDSD